jgi:serine/threonine protein kinase
MPTTQIDRDRFLAHLRQSGLLTPAQLERLVADLPASNRGRVVARALVERGLLTKFQAELLLAGRTSGFVLGQYRILDQLGQGGMGRVFKAVHGTMNRVVALKVLSPALVKTERAQQLFLREVRAAARLLHPNIVTAYDADKARNSDRYYLVMEFVDGPNLDQLVREQGPLPVAQACDLVRQAALGLQYAFEQGMVHRDIKPANLLVHRAGGGGPRPQYVVKILDFGLARLHEPDKQPQGDSMGSIETADNTVMGTPDFVSPEQARDLHQVDIRADIYSLGCSFYYLLTGQVPHPGGSTMEKLVRHSTEAPQAVEELRPEVPPAVAAIVRRMMAKAAAARFQTPAEVAAALAPFCQVGSSVWPLPELHAPSVSAAATQGSLDFPSELPCGPPAAVDDPEEWAIGTVPPDMGTVPDAAGDMPSVQLRRSLQRHQQHLLIIALGVAFGAVGFLTVVIVILLWLLTR